MKNRGKLLLVILLLISMSAFAQTSTFTYQGKLADTGMSANGPYDFRFRIFDGSGTQIGPDALRDDVTVTDGIFTVNLDFGSAQFLDSSAATIEIAVRPGASTGAYTTLAPRKPLTSSPYAIKSMNAGTATNATQLGGVAANQYVQTADTRLSDQRNPLPGSSNYIQNNPSTQQPSSNFNISGNGIVGGKLGVGTAAPVHQVSVAGGPSWTSDFWTGSIDLPNVSAFGWRPNTAGQSFGIGQTNWGLSFFRSQSPPGSTAQPPVYAMNIHNSGNIGMGITTPSFGRLHVDNQGGNAIYGKSPNNIGVWGESTSSWGAHGKSNTGAGVVGLSDSWIGVYGESNSFQGVHGKSTTNAGVVGVGNALAGVYGESASGNGVWGKSTGAGRAMFAEGNVTQSRDKGGWVKAMVFVDRFGNIIRCYNGITGASSGGCGFTAVPIGLGFYRIDFGFQVSDRFFSGVARYDGNDRSVNIATSEDTWSGSGLTVNQIYVAFRSLETGQRLDSYFYVIVY